MFIYTIILTEGIVPIRESPLVGLLRGGLGAGGTCGGCTEVKDAALPALALLRALHAISRHWHSLYRAACRADQRALVPNADFINAKVLLRFK